MKNIDAPTRLKKRMEFTRVLAQEGYTDILTLTWEDARMIFSPKFNPKLIEIIDWLRDNEGGSLEELADEMGVTKRVALRDIQRLAEIDVVDYERDGENTIVRLKHETVVIEPIV